MASSAVHVRRLWKKVCSYGATEKTSQRVRLKSDLIARYGRYLSPSGPAIRHALLTLFFESIVMTYKVPKMSGAVYDCVAGTLLNRPNLAALIGCIVAEWAQVEDSLAACYGYLLSSGWRGPTGVRITQDAIGTDGKTISVNLVNLADLAPAHQVFEILESIRTKMELLERLTETQAPDLLAHWRLTVSPKIRVASKARNAVAHSRWAIRSDIPDALLMMPSSLDPFGDILAYRESDFEESRKKIYEAADLTLDFQIMIQDVLSRNTTSQAA